MRANTRIYVLFLTINQKPPRFYVLILTNKPNSGLPAKVGGVVKKGDKNAYF